MKFDWNFTGPMVDIGIQDAKNVVAMGEGKTFEAFQHWHKTQGNKPSLSFFDYLKGLIV